MFDIMRAFRDNMKKLFVVVFVALSICLSLTSCWKEKDNGGHTDNSDQSDNSKDNQHENDNDPKRFLYVFCTQLFTYSPYIPLKRPIFDQCFRYFRTEKFYRWSKMWSLTILPTKPQYAKHIKFN